MENVYFTVGHRQEQHLKSTGLEEPHNLCLHLVLRLPAAEVGLDVSIEVTLGSPVPPPPQDVLAAFPSCSGQRQAGWLASVLLWAGPVHCNAAAPPCPRLITTTLPPRTQPRFFFQDSMVSHLAGSYQGFSCPGPAGHSGLLLILQGSSQMSNFRDSWGPWVLDQIG